MPLDINAFIHELDWAGVPTAVQDQTRLCLLDLLGVAASGINTDLSNIIRQHAWNQFGSGESSARMLFDGRRVSPIGAALAGGMTIDSIDAHDGHRGTKGHAGCGVLPGLLALLDALRGDQVSESELLVSLLIGYEIGCRAGLSLHSSVSDYHTSGAWIALAAAALGARIMNLDLDQTRHALGIAEYHGPRSQMMRCIAHPTMVKDGSGWGAMAGVSAAYLAQSGFTGAPAITVEQTEQAHYWDDLATRWRITEQYLKPFPVCRWAQPAVTAILNLHSAHSFTVADVKSLRIDTFYESAQLACRHPDSTEQAQYSLPFSAAAALIHKRITVAQISGAGLVDPDVRALADRIIVRESDEYNEVFPNDRISNVLIELNDGRILESGATRATGDPETPLTVTEIHDKFVSFAQPTLGTEQSAALAQHVLSMGERPNITLFNTFIYPDPI